MLGSNNILIDSIKPPEAEAVSPERIRMGIYGLTYEDERRLRETFDAIEQTFPVKAVRREGRVGGRSLDVRLVGTTPGWFDLVGRPLAAGRTLLPADLERSARVAVLTEQVARRLFPMEEILGEGVRVGGAYFQVVGVVRSRGGESGGIQAPDQESDVYVPLSTARELFGDVSIRRTAGSRILEKVELHQILVRVGNLEQVEPVARGAEEMLQRFHSRTDYRINVPLALLRQAEASRRTFNIVLGSIAGISLLVGGIGIMNIMLATVTERTREIGIRRAIGARRRQIVGQFLVETMVLSTVGGLIGIAVGLLIPWAITRFAGLPTVVTPFSLVLALVISMAVGILFGLYPAARAARLDPIEALRHE
jgi:putative ABC transport system permease protein